MVAPSSLFARDGHQGEAEGKTGISCRKRRDCGKGETREEGGGALTRVLTGSRPGLHPEHLLGSLASSGSLPDQQLLGFSASALCNACPTAGTRSPEPRRTAVPHSILACSPQGFCRLSPIGEDRAEAAPGGSCGIPEWAWDVQRTVAELSQGTEELGWSSKFKSGREAR